MKVLEELPLASLTTFKVGGPATLVVECETVEDIKTAVMLAHDRGLPWYVIGGGSNLVASDDGYRGVIILIKISGLTFEDAVDGSATAVVGAGVVWDMFVHACTAKGLWGVENLAGIPGTVGAAPVQNIGAYGAELADTFQSVDVLDTKTDNMRRMSADECAFGYRESIFKHDSSLVIVHVAFSLSRNGMPRTTYADLSRRIQEGAALDTPEAIADAVREIRSQKFPDLRVSGTAGSFFKNPVIAQSTFDELKERYPELPGFPASNGAVKVSLAWILDHVLQLRGFGHNHVRLFERQPLVIASEAGATAEEIDSLAHEVESKVLDATNISIEREVRMM